ncbi:MAG TPA: sigma-70 family RNA polymerase sigma factor [Candidatus Limnocylindria bacterium]|jgi:RNA polymerase sigma factor (sigma-70 family)|nr:sigma-70 family RNA polymerase sigma factor [Candidatus Limnocylindria bacterium]
MDQSSDLELARHYAASGSNEAFEALVERHLGMVRATARRQLANTHQAEEVCHAVFLALARKAGALPDGTNVAGWLFRATRFAAAKLARDEERRGRREREAGTTHAESLTPGDHDLLWEQLTPFLNEALDSLAAKDREALLLRYFQNRPFAEVGLNLGASEAAAKMRVARALEKLRDFFRRRGVVAGAAAIGGALSARAAEAAPGGLAMAVAASATGPEVPAGAGAQLAEFILRQMAWVRLRRWLIMLAVLVLLGTAVGVAGYLTHWFGLAASAPTAPAPWPGQ